MLHEFLTFINEYKLHLNSRKTLLAVSGGVDSMVMAELFRVAGFSFALAHCNFNLRGNESDGDEHFVKQWASNHDVEIFVRKFETQTKASQESISIQMAARDLRYAWFSELLQSQSFDYLGTAHHINDVLETTLLNLVRGTGLQGLPGITPIHEQLIRPLLFASKEQILHYAREERITWREDSSNESEYYRRNLIRHRVIPVLQQINPSLESTFKYTSERLRAANSLLREYLIHWKKEHVRMQGEHVYISIDAVKQAKEPTIQLHSILDSFGYSYAQTRQIVAALDQTSGKLFFSVSHQLLKDRTDLIIHPISDPPALSPVLIEKTTSELTLPGLFRLENIRQRFTPDLLLKADRSTAHFDESLIQFPLTIRPWQIGDWFYPFGMKGKRKKISDLLVNEKVPLLEKKNCRVLLDQDQRILWVIGIRTDERFKVSSSTTQIFSMMVIK